MTLYRYDMSDVVPTFTLFPIGKRAHRGHKSEQAMPAPISTSPLSPFPGSTPLAGAPASPVATPLGASPLGSATPATGIASLTVDGLDPSTGGLGVRRVRATPGVVEPAGVLSQFPLHDLSQITTEGRYAQGFRLDSGSLRLMWMSVRRTSEADGTPGFEVFFQAHGAAVERYKKRLEQAGATSSSFAFFASDPDPASEAGKSTLKKNGQKWNPSGTALTLEQAGKWAVDFVTESPEAIKGALRLRVQGNDADATKALNEVITKLGLQSAFAPPTPQALEKLKIMRLLWQIAPGAADRLRFRPREELAALPELGPAAKDADATAAQAIAAADLSSAPVTKRVQLASLLYDKSPRAFLEWAKSDSASVSGILPSSSSNPDGALDTALVGAGVPTQGEAYKAALATPPVDADARALLSLGLLAKKALVKAQDLAGRDVEHIKLPELQDLCAELGVSEARIAGLRFDEVYPGYFTVVDPSLSPQLHAAGARYLYSTSDNPERVWQMLTGGQKASLTRFQEGLLIQGKSSSSDFNTGGAASVFSRLVTDSVITKAKRGDSGYETQFHDWSGSRPYKLIINRRVLDRTDWYGFNGDNFGRTTNLKPENHGEALVKTINGAFSRSNEVCFPIGNDTAYVDYVACATDKQRQDLIDLLTSKGMTEWHGKPLSDFVIVATKLMDHPDDVTLLSSVRDAIVLDGLKEPRKAVAEPVKLAVEAKVAEVAPPAAASLAEAEALSTGRTRLETKLNQSSAQVARDAVSGHAELLAALDAEGTKAKVQPVAEAAAREAARAKLESLSGFSTYSLDVVVRQAPEAAAKAATEAVAAELLAALVAAAPAPTDNSYESKKAVREKLEAELRPAVRLRIAELVKVSDTAPGQAKAEAMVAQDGVTNARYEAQTAAKNAVGDAAVLATDPAALAALLAVVTQDVQDKLGPVATKAVSDDGVGWIRSTLKAALETQASAAALEVAVPAAEAAVLGAGQAAAEALATTAREAFAAKFPAKVTPELQAEIPATIASALAELARTDAEAQVKSLVPSLVQKHADDAATAAFAEVGPALAGEAVAAVARAAARTAVEAPVRKAAADVADAVYLDVVKAVAEELKTPLGEKLVQASRERVTQALGDTWANWAVNNTLAAAVDQVMAKVVPPAAPPS
jgi:hypothetical protein